MKLRHRKVNLRVLTIDTILYRIFVVVEQTFIYWLIGKGTGLWGIKMALGSSLIWNIINMVTYFVWHWGLFHWFKMGEGKGKQ